jgi:hypothetical protein
MSERGIRLPGQEGAEPRPRCHLTTVTPDIGAINPSEREDQNHLSGAVPSM